MSKPTKGKRISPADWVAERGVVRRRCFCRDITDPELLADVDAIASITGLLHADGVRYLRDECGIEVTLMQFKAHKAHAADQTQRR